MCAGSGTDVGGSRHEKLFEDEEDASDTGPETDVGGSRQLAANLKAMASYNLGPLGATTTLIR